MPPKANFWLRRWCGPIMGADGGQTRCHGMITRWWTQFPVEAVTSQSWTLPIPAWTLKLSASQSRRLNTPAIRKRPLLETFRSQIDGQIPRIVRPQSRLFVPRLLRSRAQTRQLPYYIELPPRGHETNCQSTSRRTRDQAMFGAGDCPPAASCHRPTPPSPR